MAGQTARFECIVQSHPQPQVIWQRNGCALQQSAKHLLEYRNGVCRLTIANAYPGKQPNTTLCLERIEAFTITSVI